MVKLPAYKSILRWLPVLFILPVFLFITYGSYNVAFSNKAEEITIQEDDDNGINTWNFTADGESQIHTPSGQRLKRHFYLHAKSNKKYFVKACCNDWQNNGLAGISRGRSPVLMFYEPDHITRPFYYLFLFRFVLF